MNTISSFTHKMAAHCESGTVAALLAHKGLALSEPMVFGVSAGIFFAYLDSRNLPFPMFVMRNRPGIIPRKLCKRIGADFAMTKFRDPAKAESALRGLIDKGVPVAVQVDIFEMSYFPAHMRVHFNGHFVTVTGYDDTSYTLSDCYAPGPTVVPREALNKARFARGMMAPHGFMFHARGVPTTPNLPAAIDKGIKEASFNMVKLPVPFVGVRGMRLFSRKVLDWPQRARDIDHLSHEIMKIHIFLEEQGTGGGGFRFMYATFLQQATTLLERDDLAEFSKEMMNIGDKWREISLFVARIGKKRDLGLDRLKELSAMLVERADAEQAFFVRLLKAVK